VWWLIGALVLVFGLFALGPLGAVVAGSFARHAIASNRRTEEVSDEILRDTRALLAQAARSTPQEFEHDLRQRIESRMQSPGSPEQAFRLVIAIVAAKLSRRCLESWLRAHPEARADSAFALHDYMRDYDICEAMTGSDAWEHFTREQRGGLHALASEPDSDSLSGDLRAQVRTWMDRSDAPVRWLGAVEQPVAADIYGLARGDEVVVDSWPRYSDWLAAHAPAAREALRPPADPADLQRLEAAIGLPLPASLRALYLVHDGQDFERCIDVFPDGRWLPVCEVIESIEQIRSDPRWEVGWCPFVAWDGGLVAVSCHGDGEFVYDLWYEDGARLVACDLADWLARVLRDVETGAQRFEPEIGFAPGR
jgi:hypothetical protein